MEMRFLRRSIWLDPKSHLSAAWCANRSPILIQHLFTIHGACSITDTCSNGLNHQCLILLWSYPDGKAQLTRTNSFEYFPEPSHLLDHYPTPYGVLRCKATQPLQDQLLLYMVSPCSVLCKRGGTSKVGWMRGLAELAWGKLARYPMLGAPEKGSHSSNTNSCLVQPARWWRPLKIKKRLARPGFWNYRVIFCSTSSRGAPLLQKKERV